MLLDPKLLGTRIRDARERLKLSQEELAAAVTKDQGAISEYESGKRKLAATDLPTFASALNVSVLYFFEDDDSPPELDSLMLETFRELPSAMVKHAAIQIVRILSDVAKSEP